jgi:hypothetical protein
MVLHSKSRGSGSGCFIRFLVLVVVGFMLIGPLLRCAQRLPQMAANTAGHAASGVTSAAGNAVSNLGQRLLHGLESLWNTQSPTEQFNRVCENLPVEGVDKLCPYFTAPLQGASDAQAAQTACYLAAAGSGTGGQQRLQQIHQTCPQTTGDASGFQSCVQTYVQQNVESGDWSSCLAGSPQQLWSEVHTMIKPIACPPGLPESLCTTQSSSGQPSSASTAAADTSAQTRTDPNYLNCLQYYYQKLPAYNQPLACGTTTNAQNAACVKQTLQNFSYQGQSVGANQIAYCNGMPQ